jgi:hypothetical protein
MIIDWDRRAPSASAARRSACDRLPLPADVGDGLGWLLAPWTPCVLHTQRVHSIPSTRARTARPERHQLHGAPRLAARSNRFAYQGSAPVASFAGYADARRGRLARRDRSEILRHRDSQTTTIYAKVDLVLAARAGPALAGSCAMKPLTKVDSRLPGALRRSLGFKLRDAGARHSPKFASFMEQQTRRLHVTTATGAALGAAASRGAAGALGAAPGLRSRCFARHHLASDPQHRGSAAWLAAVPPGPRTIPTSIRPTRSSACSNTRFGNCHQSSETAADGRSTRCWVC